MSKPILIDALHICMGGGLMILNHLVNNLVTSDIEFFLLKDIRCPKLNSEDKVENLLVLPSDNKTRKDFFRTHRNDFSTVLCFGNIPPTVKMNVPVHTYLHNVSLLKIPEDYSFKAKIKSLLKKLYIKHYSKFTDSWIVQTENTAQLVKNHLAHKGQSVEIYPFYYIPTGINHTPKRTRNDYVFIGDHTSAKGHEYLVDAWVKLANRGFKEKLHLTVTDPDFIKVIDAACAHGAAIINHGKISFEKVVELYNQAKATVYPSLNESLGLGIVEALEAGCDVIGSDLPFLHSVCIPSLTFKPSNSDSIVEAVLTYEAGKCKNSEIIIRDTVSDFIKFLKDNGRQA